MAHDPDDNTPRFPKPPKRDQRPDPQDEGEDDSRMNWGGPALFIVGLVILMLFLFAQSGGNRKATALPYSDLIAAVNEGRVKSARVVQDNNTGEQRVVGKLASTEGKEVEFSTVVNLTFSRNLEDVLRDKAVPLDVEYTSNIVAQSLLALLPLVLVLAVFYFIFRQQIRMAGRSAFNFGKSRGKLVTRDKNRVMFRDVAGADESKEEVQEIVDFLRDPKKFQKLGGRIPKGVLMVGPPGTGKTLLAKAIAGEADVPFFSISGSDFVEMFVGVGASRVRDLFEQGKRNAPCLIFIDEIDAVGRSRGHGIGGGNDEREQTLNALLVEMDGFETQEGIILIAATNRKDVLDPALLRPGRFDREVHVHLPDVRGREEILKVHAAKVKLGAEVDLKKVGRGTPGYSGAELANLVNEAALLAAKKNRKAITQADMEEARDKVRWGRECRSMAMSADEKKNTAYHEAGHALLNLLLEHCDPLHKVSIIPRGPALGVTMNLPEGDRYTALFKELDDKLCMIMGGRVAEELFMGDITNGASGDIRQATWYARKMVCEWGMSEKLGMVGYTDEDDLVFLGRDISRARHYSEETQREIDREVRRLVDAAYARAKRLIGKNREKLEAIAEALLEYETLDGDQIRELITIGRMTSPPAKAEGAAPAKPAASTPRADEDELPGDLHPAPA